MAPLIWIIDEEWSDYQLENELIHQRYPGATIKYSGYDYLDDYRNFGYRADLILAQVYVSLPRKTIEGLINCKGIAIFGGGYDRIDITAAADKGILVTNVQGYCAEDIANYVLTAVLNANKSFVALNAQVSQGSWGLPAMTTLSSRPNEQTAMIIGLGTIGRAVAKRLQQIGLSVISYDPYVSPEEMAQQGIKSVQLMAGLKIADYVSIHCNLSTETTHLIGRDQFQVMKPSSLLVNSSRGKVLDEDALVTAVNGHEIAGATLDVITHEPPILTDPVFHTDHIVVTPHISYLSKESIKELKYRAVTNALTMYENKRPADVVN